MKNYIFTKESFNRLQKSISAIRKNLDVISKDKAQSGLGQDGWHDEGFKRALVEEMMWGKRLMELEQISRTAKIIIPKEQNKYVEIGNGVLIEYENGSKLKFILEGYIFGKTNNCVSAYSPVGQAIRGACKGEKRNLQIRGKNKTIKILDIFFPSVAKNVCNQETIPN
ncbi:MAG: hypothetical protein ACTSUT_00025 [Promethearchaeota archaeon]